MALLNSLRKLLTTSGDRSSEPGGDTASTVTRSGSPGVSTPSQGPVPAPQVSATHAAVPSTQASAVGGSTLPAAAFVGAGATATTLQATPEWLRFSARLFGFQRLRDVPPHPQEAPLLQRLHARSGADWAELLPRLPAVLPQLLRLMRRENLSSRELVDLLSRDPSLVGELMRMANSAMYRPEREITDLASAVMVIGHEGLNQVVLRVTMRPIFNQDRQGRFSRQAGTLPWDLSERCAFAAMCLSPPGDERFAAYLAGLGAQVGLMALLRVLDGLPVGQRPSLDREGLHRQLLPLTADWSARIVTHWGFPGRVAEAIAVRPGQGAEVAVLAAIVREAHAVALRHLLQPGLTASQLGDWSLAQQRAYAALEERFNASGDAPALSTAG
ncbi:HD-like signal output (HDOD) domain, no enzymatic activity [Roseateles sp. YR242]|uniref:HDOD domain-containing protein n=1 Tax=Roseateles sp. YR242 TaxID=1855305 RepID=UPI0008BA394D|nr:HDOD domain-containing protein [Roseateles sp. YR242]SEL50574.1 HD-like signal output (HDOD) domain, no enzymatic activity [Roseateles sp. YR242]